MSALTAGMCGRMFEPRQIGQHFSPEPSVGLPSIPKAPPPKNSEEEAVEILHESSPKDTVRGATSLAFRGADHAL